MKKDLFNLHKEPGEQQVSAYLRKQTGPESLIDACNKAVPGDS